MAIRLWFQDPFLPETQVGQIDTFTGTSAQTTFTCVNKSYTQIGPTIQYGTTLKFLYTGGFSKTVDDEVVIDVAPPLNSQIVVPSIGAITLTTYDQASVANVSDPLHDYKNIWIGTDEPHLYTYGPRSGQVGIGISFVNNITGFSTLPDLSFVAMACCNAAGSIIGSYSASGVTLYTDKMTSFSTVAASSNSGTNTLLVASATSSDYFIEGDYVVVNIGYPTAEIIQVSSISYNTLNLASNFNYPHYVDETVFFYCRQFKVRGTMTENFTSNTTQNYYNLSCRIEADESQRS